MKERPILFGGLMVRAIIEGRKTETRRLIQLPNGLSPDEPGADWFYSRSFSSAELAVFIDSRRPVAGDIARRSPCGAPGDRLWVREAHQIATGRESGDLGAVIRYRDGEMQSVTMPAASPMPLGLTWDRWRPSIHMPRWASRLLLEVEGVRVERLRDITIAGVRAEGFDPDSRGFEEAWAAAYGPGSWDQNPWIWAVKFRRVVDGATA